MHDMLVRLYALPGLNDAVASCTRQGVTIRRPLAPENPVVVDWVRAHFPTSAAEVETTLRRVPISCFIAVRAERLLGFACYDATCPNAAGSAARAA